jgi:hypothetical protein
VPDPAPRADSGRVVTPLLADRIEEVLVQLGLHDRWAHVTAGIRHGFDMGIRAQPERSVIHPNHSSVEAAPSFIDEYIAGECAGQRYLGPFSPTELEALVGPFIVSPLGLVPKQGSSSKWRLIQDLSFPCSSANLSVNAGIQSNDFLTEWGTFTETAQLILGLPDGCSAATFDVSAAYRITPVHPEQQHALCVMWHGKTYLDLAAPFGLRSSAGVFGSIADMLVSIYAAHGFGPIRKWVDDFFVVRLPGGSWSEEDFISLTARLGVPWSMTKLRRLAVIQRYIGLDWNLVTRTVSMPPEKTAAILELAQAWLAHEDSTESEAARLHGKLVYLATMYPLIRPFLRAISRFVAKFTSSRASLSIPTAVHADLTWILEITPLLPVELPLSRPGPEDIGWWGDASTSFGVGVVVGEFWGVWKWADGFQVGPRREYDIGWAEAVAVELGLQMLHHHEIMTHLVPPSTSVLVRSDNAGVVAVTNSGRSRSRATNEVLKVIYQSLAGSGLSLVAQHIPGVINISDPLSRGDIRGFLAAFPAAQTRTSIVLPPRLSSKLIPFK